MTLCVQFILVFVSTGVGQVLQEDMPARERMSSAYFFCERNRPCNWRVTGIPKKQLSCLKSFIGNPELRREMINCRKVSEEAVRMISST
ncbi:hypothetical protein A2U01_0059323 [Trifolium medium]|uniref:Uncharacterized protein n=1 Tax=Trifolium medium TaxID=97028 RepID=A0A392RR87_9FABA|nr:hypothetical protein [Trifolium medium]